MKSEVQSQNSTGLGIADRLTCLRWNNFLIVELNDLRKITCSHRDCDYRMVQNTPNSESIKWYNTTPEKVNLDILKLPMNEWNENNV